MDPLTRPSSQGFSTQTQDLFEDAPNGFVVVDAAGQIVRVNQQLERISGYRRAELLGQPMKALIPVADGRHVSLAGRDGQAVPVDIALLPTNLVDAGQVVFVVRDRSERNEAAEEVRASNARLAEAQRIAHIGTWTWEVESNTVFRSSELRRIFGFGAEDDAAQGDYAKRIHPDDRDRVQSATNRSIRELSPFEIEYRIVQPGGAVRWIEAGGDIAEARDGRVVRMAGYCLDITDRRVAEELQHQALQDLSDYQRILERVARDEDLPSILESLCIEVEKRLVGAMCSILLVDDADRTLHHAAAPSLPVEFWRAIDGLPIVRGLGACGNAAATGEMVIVEDLMDDPLTAVFVELGGEYQLRSVWSYPLKSASGAIIGTFAVYRHETHRPDGAEIGVVKMAGDLAAMAIERKLADDALTAAAQVDPLTGLPNRARFLQELQHQLNRGQGLLAVMFVDLDRFKWINDSLGHPVGDRILVEAARRIRASVPQTSFVARFGGDEFTVIVPDASEARASRVASALEEAFGEPFTLDGGEFFLSVSVGICADDRAVGAFEMVRDADAAMYAAKEQGRARHVWFDEGLRQRAIDRLTMESKLRRGLERDEFLLHYQPVVNLKTGRWAGVEALVRWAHPVDGLRGPDEFIPLAEETGLILPLGQVIFQKVVDAAPELWAMQLGPIAANLSPVQLSDPSLPTWMRAARDAMGLEPGAIVLELTESSLMEGFERAEPVLAELAEAGFLLVIDDFGTGYSSIARLTQMPVSGIKIDRTFTARLGEDPSAERVVGAIIDLAHAFELVVVAEGVETEYALDRLRDLGCDLAQGYFLSRPVERDRLTSTLESTPPPF